MSSTNTQGERGHDPLRDRVDRLAAEVERLEERVAELEAQDGSPSSSTLPEGATDYRDARVIEALTPGETVTPRRLRDLYRDRTDIRDSDTLRDRTKALVGREPFEPTGQSTWRFKQK